MKRLLLFAIAISLAGLVKAQLITVTSGNDLYIKSGTVFHADGLTIIPSSDFTISDNTLNKLSTVAHTSPNTYISRVYQFSNNTNLFNGAVQINYNDGAELNGISENQLTLSVHNGTTWRVLAPFSRDATNNFVLTNNVSSILNELTLIGSQLSPLPLTWLSFTATKQNQTALLNWTTSQEINTRDFTVQHSVDGAAWANIGLLSAAGTSTTNADYSYLHTNPIQGLNYYRILQSDMDNRSSYSETRVLKFTNENAPFTIIGNLVTNAINLQVHMNTDLSIYAADGKLIWREFVNTGTKTIDVSWYAKGIYFMVANGITQKIVIQ